VAGPDSSDGALVTRLAAGAELNDSGTYPLSFHCRSPQTRDSVSPKEQQLRDTVKIVCELYINGLALEGALNAKGSDEVCLLRARHVRNFRLRLEPTSYRTASLPTLAFLYTLEQLLAKMNEVIAESPIRPHLGKLNLAPLWIPRIDADYLVVTCPGMSSFRFDCR
jgi:hypothetical protein